MERGHKLWMRSGSSLRYGRQRGDTGPRLATRHISAEMLTPIKLCRQSVASAAA